MPMSMPSNAPMMPTLPDTRTAYSSQNFMPSYSRGNLPGYFIDDESQIVPKYIPNDGSISFFPFKDLSKIVIKQWDSNGINTLSYVIAPSPQAANYQTNPDVQTPDKQSQFVEQEQQKRFDPILETLQSLNNGLANTFGQFGTTLQALQQEIAQLNHAVMSVKEDLGGRG